MGSHRNSEQASGSAADPGQWQQEGGGSGQVASGAGATSNSGQQQLSACGSSSSVGKGDDMPEVTHAHGQQVESSHGGGLPTINPSGKVRDRDRGPGHGESSGWEHAAPSNNMVNTGC